MNKSSAIIQRRLHFIADFSLMTRWVSLLLLLILAALQLKLWVGSGMNDVMKLQDMVNSQARANAAQQQRNERLAAEVLDLKEGDEAIEERARVELGMVKADEVFYQVIDDQPANSKIADVSASPRQLAQAQRR
jgi:cell division protein FtsB